MSALTSPIIEVEDTLEAANDWFCREKLSDGLPIIPPTPERVETMLTGTSRDPQESIGLIPPKWAPATVEKIAINSVMAGCLPQYLPVVIAAVEAICEPRFNIYGVQATTGYVGPALLVNGPARKTLGINCDAGVFGPGFRANATIGRAIRLILITVGGGFPGETDRSTFGWPGKYTFCFGENEEKSPWEPYHVEMGFNASESTVTAFGVNGFLPIHTSCSHGEEALSSLADVLAMHHGVSHLDVGSFGGGTPLVALGIEDAEIIARDGITPRIRSAWPAQRVRKRRKTMHLHRTRPKTWMALRPLQRLVRAAKSLQQRNLARTATCGHQAVTPHR
jgi:hypothetical protein